MLYSIAYYSGSSSLQFDQIHTKKPAFKRAFRYVQLLNTALDIITLQPNKAKVLVSLLHAKKKEPLRLGA
ncbi:hypothetical protein C7W93_00385 [Glaciimonas sp. PCH181]|nr:hypothetical protein C7W93_00385 [Glaciimonas sp. PCH181]